MSFTRFGNALVAFLVLPLAAVTSQCSETGVEGTDSGAQDAAAPDVSTTSDRDATVCGPNDVSNWVPETMHPPNAPYAGKCTTQQCIDFAACEAGNTSTCAEFAPGQPAETCGACIDTQASSPIWGVIVFDGSLGTVNVEGCVDDALGQVYWEKANGGSGSCGDLLHAWYGCEHTACSACSGDELVACLDAADASGCASYDAAVHSATGACASVLGDAAPAAIDSCFPDLGITDLAKQRADFLTRIAKYMCGPHP